MKLISIPGKANANLYRHPTTGIIYVRMYKEGKGRLEKSTGTDKLSDARIIADDLKFKFLGKKNPRQGQSLCGELFEEFIEQKSIKSQGTINSIRASWKHLKPYIEGMLPEEINEVWWEKIYIPKKRIETHKNRKFFNDHKWLRMFLLSLQRQGVIERRPNLVNPDPERDAGRVYSDKEIERLLAHADGDLKLQIKMAYTMGMRWGEILGLTFDRIDVLRGTIKLRAEDTKIRKQRIFAISDSVRDELVERKKISESLYLFPMKDDPTRPRKRDGMKTQWENCKKNAGVTGRFHFLRHTFLTKAFKSPGANPALICHYAGLSLEEAQKTYLHFTVEDTRAVASIVEL